jgi:hypothetical protein
MGQAGGQTRFDWICRSNHHNRDGAGYSADCPRIDLARSDDDLGCCCDQSRGCNAPALGIFTGYRRLIIR